MQFLANHLLSAVQVPRVDPVFLPTSLAMCPANTYPSLVSRLQSSPLFHERTSFQNCSFGALHAGLAVPCGPRSAE